MRRIVHAGVPLLTVCVVGVLGVSGCGGHEVAPKQGATTVTSTVTAAPTTPDSPQQQVPASPRQSAPSTAADASSVVLRYFAAIDAQDYRRAWDLGGKNLSATYAAFAAGFGATSHDTVSILGTDGATVSVSLEATQTDGSAKTYEGTYTVHGGTIVSADVHEVTAPQPQPSGASPYYKNCAEARAAHAAPLHKNDPGYAPRLDRDHDGVACEPYEP